MPINPDYFVGALTGPLAGPLTGTPMYKAEPALPCYVYASGQCPGAAAAKPNALTTLLKKK